MRRTVWGRCGVCAALLDEEDLFCANCGTAAPHDARAGSVVAGSAGSQAAQTRAVDFQCSGCGASMAFDAEAGALRCPFCGATQLRQQPETARLLAERVIPFAIERRQAIDTMRRWLGHGFWRPGDLARAALVTRISPVYVPYWVFQAHTHTYWTADSSQTPPGARGDWFPVTGEHHGTYSGVLVSASSVLTPAETSALCPFDLSALQPAAGLATRGEVVEQFRVKRKYARPLATQGLEAMEAQACQSYVPGRARNLKVNLRIEGLTSEPILLPVWMAAYRYKSRVFRFLINGQSGRATGEAPISWTKVGGALLIACLAILLMLLLVALANATSPLP